MKSKYSPEYVIVKIIIKEENINVYNLINKLIKHSNYLNIIKIYSIIRL